MQTSKNTILITGGGSGIGRGLAEAFHKLDNQVVIAGRGRAKLDETVVANPGMQALTFDVTDAAAIRRFAHEALERFPEVNVLVNNAGVMRLEDVTQADVADAEVTVATNLLGPIRLSAAFLPHLLAQRHAAILNVTSGLAFVPLTVTPTYCATKAALHSYSLSLREQLRGTSVEVIEIPPPYVQTHLTGDHQARDPRAMPLDDYVAATMKILTEQPDAKEVIIDRVAGMRHAEAEGRFDQVFQQLCEMGRERKARQGT